MKSYVARQPIFRKDSSVYGYELLYRESETNAFNPDMDGNIATKTLISNITTTFDLDSLSDKKLVFINFTEELLTSNIPFLLAPDQVVIEILETVKITDMLLKRLWKLKEKGYIFAIDDYVNNPYFDKLVDLADIIKVDFREMNQDKYDLPRRPKFRDKIMLAEKVETKEEFDRAKAGKYKCFQGYYFMKPIIFSKAEMSISPTTYARMMNELRDPRFDYDRLAKIIKLDVNVTYKLLYKVNTLKFFRKYRIQSVKQALTHMGMEEVFRWVMLLLIRDCAKSSSDELLKIALVRGVFCEEVANIYGMGNQKREEAFITGMFSVFDIMMGHDFADTLDEVGVTDDVKEALLGNGNEFREILDFALCYEHGEWEEAADYIKKHEFNQDQITESYLEAVKYADRVFAIPDQSG